MNLKKMLALAGAALLCMAATSVMAQDNGPGPGPGPGGPGGRRGNFDPAQRMQQRIDEIRQQMDVKDDAEWKVIQERLQKVMDARREAMPPFGGRRRGGPDGNNPPGGPGGRGMFGQPSPELEALNKAIESNAPTDQVKAALEKYRVSRKAKETALEKAQAELQKVLTVKQEAVAVANGMLN